jgi:thioredoxin
MSDLITETTDATFEADVLQSDLPVLLDLWAPWCGPCLALAPMLERIATQYEGRVRVVKYNVDENKGSWERFNVRGIPTLLVFRDGTEVARNAGASASWLNSVLDAAQRKVQPAQAATLRGFGGDAARKAQCLAVLRKAIDAGRLSKPESDGHGPGVTATDCDYVPSRHVTTDPGADCSTVLGVPAALAVLHDHFFESLPADGSDTRFALDWVEAIPVGADLTGVPEAYLQWLMHDPVWGLEHAFPRQGEPRALWKQIVEYRGQKLAGTTPADAIWNALNDRCMEMRRIFRQEENRSEEYLCDCLADIIEFLRNSDGPALATLSDTALSVQRNEMQATRWTEAELALMSSHRSEINELYATLGPRPQEPGDAFEAFAKRVEEIIDPVNAAFEAAHPELDERWEAIAKTRRELRDAAMAAQRQRLLELLRASRPAEGI